MTTEVGRGHHHFTFKASAISEAAANEARYHREREQYWLAELEKSKKLVRETASIEFREFAITGGSRLGVEVKYGDQFAYSRMGEASEKITFHRARAESLETSARLYGTQGECFYDLIADDVYHFNLGGAPR